MSVLRSCLTSQSSLFSQPKKTHLGSMMNHFFISFLLGVYQCYCTDTLVSVSFQLQPNFTASSYILRRDLNLWSPKNNFPIKSKSIFRQIILPCILRRGQAHQVLPKACQGVHQVVLHLPHLSLHIDHFRRCRKSGHYTTVQSLVILWHCLPLLSYRLVIYMINDAITDDVNVSVVE